MACYLLVPSGIPRELRAVRKVHCQPPLHAGAAQVLHRIERHPQIRGVGAAAPSIRTHPVGRARLTLGLRNLALEIDEDTLEDGADHQTPLGRASAPASKVPHGGGGTRGLEKVPVPRSAAGQRRRVVPCQPV